MIVPSNKIKLPEPSEEIVENDEINTNNFINAKLIDFFELLHVGNYTAAYEKVPSLIEISSFSSPSSILNDNVKLEVLVEKLAKAHAQSKLTIPEQAFALLGILEFILHSFGKALYHQVGFQLNDKGILQQIDKLNYTPLLEKLADESPEIKEVIDTTAIKITMGEINKVYDSDLAAVKKLKKIQFLGNCLEDWLPSHPYSPANFLKEKQVFIERLKEIKKALGVQAVSEISNSKFLHHYAKILKLRKLLHYQTSLEKTINQHIVAYEALQAISRKNFQHAWKLTSSHILATQDNIAACLYESFYKLLSALVYDPQAKMQIENILRSLYNFFINNNKSNMSPEDRKKIYQLFMLLMKNHFSNFVFPNECAFIQVEVLRKEIASFKSRYFPGGDIDNYLKFLYEYTVSANCEIKEFTIKCVLSLEEFQFLVENNKKVVVLNGLQILPSLITIENVIFSYGEPFQKNINEYKEFEKILSSFIRHKSYASYDDEDLDYRRNKLLDYPPKLSETLFKYIFSCYKEEKDRKFITNVFFVETWEKFNIKFHPYPPLFNTYQRYQNMIDAYCIPIMMARLFEVKALDERYDYALERFIKLFLRLEKEPIIVNVNRMLKQLEDEKEINRYKKLQSCGPLSFQANDNPFIETIKKIGNLEEKNIKFMLNMSKNDNFIKINIRKASYEKITAYEGKNIFIEGIHKAFIASKESPDNMYQAAINKLVELLANLQLDCSLPTLYEALDKLSSQTEFWRKQNNSYIDTLNLLQGIDTPDLQSSFKQYMDYLAQSKETDTLSKEILDKLQSLAQSKNSKVTQLPASARNDINNDDKKTMYKL